MIVNTYGVVTALVRRSFLCIMQTEAATMQPWYLAAHLLASICALMCTVAILLAGRRHAANFGILVSGVMCRVSLHTTVLLDDAEQTLVTLAVGKWRVYCGPIGWHVASPAGVLKLTKQPVLSALATQQSLAALSNKRNTYNIFYSLLASHWVKLLCLLRGDGLCSHPSVRQMTMWNSSASFATT
jgi:hypothetical protein